MTHPMPSGPDLVPTPRPRGRLGQWSDRVKALLLLSLLAVAGALAGVGAPGAAAERARDGLSVGGTMRAFLTETPAALVQGNREQAHPDLAGGDPPPAKLLPHSIAADGFFAPGEAIRARPHDPVKLVRAGHAARMPTGPPAGLSA